MALVDTNVLLDLFTADPVWADWSEQQLEILRQQEDLLINAVVYAELAGRASSVETLDAALVGLGVQYMATPRAALYLAGKAFAIYRKRGGVRTGVLADFFIGALAAVENLPILTRDPRKYRAYFPTVRLIAP